MIDFAALTFRHLPHCRSCCPPKGGTTAANDGPPQSAALRCRTRITAATRFENGKFGYGASATNFPLGAPT